MTIRRILLVAALLSVAATAIGRAVDAEQEIARLSRRIDDVYVKSDTTFVEEVVAEDWMLISPDGRVEDKADLLKALKDGSTKFTKVNTSEVKARVLGDAAVVTGRFVAEYQKRGRETIDTGRFSRVFVRIGGKWQYVHSQSTPVLAELPSVHRHSKKP